MIIDKKKFPLISTEQVEKLGQIIEKFRNKVNFIDTSAEKSNLEKFLVKTSYGVKLPLRNTALVNNVAGHKIIVTPYDEDSVEGIRKQIQKIQPSATIEIVNSGKSILLTLEPLFAEKREEEYQQNLRKLTEEALIKIRDIRHKLRKAVQFLGEEDKKINNLQIDELISFCQVEIEKFKKREERKIFNN